VGIAGVVVLLIVLWAILSTDGGNSGLERVVVRLKWLHQAQFAGFYVADKKNLYRDVGMKVTIHPGGVDFPAIQMISAGNEHFGVTGADQILIAREKGVPVVAIAAIYRRNPLVLFSLKEKGITKPSDLEGRKVGVKLGGNEELTYRALVRKTGIDASKITEVPVKYDMSPLFSGTVDVWPGYVINEPVVAEEKGYEVNIIWPSDYGVNMYADTLFTTERMIRENPELVQRFVKASLEGWEYAATHQDEAVRYTLTYSDKLRIEHEAAMMAASLQLLKPDDSPIGTMDRKVWEQMQKLLLENGFLKKPVDLDRVYSTRFLEK